VHKRRREEEEEEEGEEVEEEVAQAQAQAQEQAQVQEEQQEQQEQEQEEQQEDEAIDSVGLTSVDGAFILVSSTSSVEQQVTSDPITTTKLHIMCVVVNVKKSGAHHRGTVRGMYDRRYTI
jgi:hypothetical protein